MSECDILRQETLDSQSARSDLLKWKLLLVAGLGGAGLGVGSQAGDSWTENFRFLVCLIPLVCLYVDLLCNHLSLRMIVIGSFIKEYHEQDGLLLQCYERFASQLRQAGHRQMEATHPSLPRLWNRAKRRVSALITNPEGLGPQIKTWFKQTKWGFKESGKENAYVLEDWALELSTYFLSLSVILHGVIIAILHGKWADLFHTSNSVFWLWALSFTSGGIGLFLTKSLHRRSTHLSKEIQLLAAERPWIESSKQPDALPASLIIQDNRLLDYIRHHYSPSDIQSLQNFIQAHRTFEFSPLDNGLFPAASFNTEQPSPSGYQYVWVRDNIYVAYAHYTAGATALAVQNAQALAAYFNKHIARFTKIIDGEADPDDPMRRPHVRFEGRTMAEIDQKWAHAQNDALGYFLWFYCKLALDGAIPSDQLDANLLETFAKYFDAIEFWQDMDSGHWEEQRKISASSIGVVTGALSLAKDLIGSHPGVNSFTAHQGLDLEALERLIANGKAALKKILPNECTQPGRRRRVDAALLFLVYPICIVDDDMADEIVHRVINTLQGDYGIRRYQGDSYWAPDYKRHLPENRRTIDFSEDLEYRNRLLKKDQEAQWCIFDPILSIIFGRRFRKTGDTRFLRSQTHHLNRSLAQLTAHANGALLCPEAYYVEDGRYVPNDHTPLLWTQGNLWMALHDIKISLDHVSTHDPCDTTHTAQRQ